MSVVEASINFLTRDNLYEHEKPYQLRYDVADGIPRTNLRHVKQSPLKIHNMRGREEQFSFEKHGFTVLESDEEISYDHFDNPAGISRYLNIVAKQLRLKLNADTVQVYQYLGSFGLLHFPPKNVLLTTQRFANGMPAFLMQRKTTTTSSTNHLQLLMLVCTFEIRISKSECAANTNARHNYRRSPGQVPKIEQGSLKVAARPSISSCQVG